MTKNILPVTNVIDVTITNTPSGLTENNVNSLALFTNEAPINGEAYGIYISASQVGANYGTNTTTYDMAVNIFAQRPNILSGRGRLVIIPMIAAVSATHGKCTTANLSANLAGITAAATGSLGVVIGGVSQQLTNLDFSDFTTWTEIAAYLDAKLINADVTAETNGIRITAHSVGTESTVTLAAGSTGVDFSGASYFISSTAVSVAGANSSGETIAACIARTSGLVGYVPIISTLDLDDTATTAAAVAVQALDNMFFDHRASTADIAGIATTISAAGDTRTRILLYTKSLAEANLMKAAYAGRACSVDFTGSNTSQTMNLKALVNVTPDDGITQTLYAAALVAGCDLYVSYDGVASVVSTGGNDFFDNPYSDLALKFHLITAGFNYLRQTNTKVPQTEPGMIGLKNAYRKVMIRFVTNACLAPGSWTSSETFGDPEIFDKNITNTGFYIYSQPVADQNASDREDRIAPLVQIAAKRAGAIHSSNVLVNINA